MKKEELEKLLADVTQILAMMVAVNINKEASATHAATLKTARAKLDKLQELRQEEVYWKTLSPEEQRALMTNAQNVWQTHQELLKELDFLDISKQPTFLSSAVNELNHAYLLIEWLSDTLGKSGRTVLSHLTVLQPATFDQGKYKNQIDSLYAELEAVSYDFYVDRTSNGSAIEHNMFIPICDHLITSSMWLAKEKVRLLTEPMPEIKVINLPEEIKPEIPVSPEKSLPN